MKNFANNMSRLLGAGTATSVSTLAPSLTKMQTEVMQTMVKTQNEVGTLQETLQTVAEELKELGKRTGGIESILGTVSAKGRQHRG